MKKVRYTTQARKDLKKHRNNPMRMRQLYDALSYLVRGLPLPASYRPHKLTGQYAGCMECHLAGDFLLIWIDPDADTIEILRLGSHSELF